MQLSMKVQQEYAGLVARGDELFTGLRGEDEPGLATFDDDEPAGPAQRVGRSAFDRVAETVIEVSEDDASPADRALDELAIDQLVDETAPAEAAPSEAAPAEDADGLAEPAVLEESPDADAADAVSAAATDITESADVPAPGGGVPAGTGTPLTAPVEGYDDWSIAQLRGRLRGYQSVTVTDLVTYEESTRNREPYLRMLRNRLEKLDEQAVEASPLTPRG
jgi:hypothetical protein